MKYTQSLLFFLLVIFCVPFVSADWFYTSEEVTATITIAGDADIIRTSSKATIDHVSVNLSLFPKEYEFQTIVEEQAGPTPNKQDQSAIFRFNNPGNQISFLLTTTVNKQNSFVPVQDKVPFPIQQVPEEVKPFLEPTEIIDSTHPDIIKQASVLASGEDDLYQVVFNVAKWTKEQIQYNLSTMTADASQSASWVLTHKKGVCDELTSLFIAMLRSLGVPAKFVTGYAYTNSPLFSEEWGLHGWSEVYFPTVGWVPFDVTYGQYGFVDPTHISLKQAVDSQDSATKYQWLGRDVEVEIGNLDTSVELLEYKGKIPPLLELDAELIKEEIGYGSYNGVKLTVTNPNNYYLATELYLTVPDEVLIVGNQAQNILLKPNEEKNLFWILRIPADLSDEFVYTFPTIMSSSRNQTKVAEFTADGKSPTFSITDIGAIIEQSKEQEQKTYSANVDINCDYPPSYYVKGSAQALCTVKNTGNEFLEDAQVCYGEECKSVDLGIAQQEVVEFTLSSPSFGAQEQEVTVRHAKVSQRSTLSYEYRDTPAISLTDVSVPSSVGYAQEFTLDFDMSKTSQSNAYNVGITVFFNGQQNSWTIQELKSSQPFSISMNSEGFAPGPNELLVVLSYEDAQGQQYSTKTSTSVSLDNLSTMQKIQAYIVHYGSKPQTLITFIGVVAFMFVLLVLTVFWKR